MARQLLDAKGVAYQDTGVDGQPELRARMETESGRHTVPQIWIGDRHVGGFDDLWQLEQSGTLDSLLRAAANNET
jgi:glutaredoxin 3